MKKEAAYPDFDICAILVIANETIRRSVKAAFESNGINVFVAMSALDGLALAATRTADFFLIDADLPSKEMAGLIGQVRDWAGIPIIVLSRDSAEARKIEIFDAGADSYLVHPIGTNELLARIRSLLRRYAQPITSIWTEFRFGDMHVNLVRRTVSRSGIFIALTPTEFRLLRLFVLNEGRMLYHEHMLKEVWGISKIDRTHYLRVYVNGLRRKLALGNSSGCQILNASGVGYRFIHVRGVVG